MPESLSTPLADLRRNVIGRNAPITTPYGSRPLVYADYTASGRALASIEAHIRHTVLPWYGNTHTETSLTGAQTTALREQARQTIHRALNGAADDRIIFCGAGATAAVNKLLDILNLRLPRDLAKRYDLDGAIPKAERPVVFVGPYEHHSNELPWRESIAEVRVIPLGADGTIDRNALAAALAATSDRSLRIGAFSAASNVTGILSDVPGITRQLKDAGALSFWDYAAAGPYVRIDMNADSAPIDALFLSPHKFIGGPGTPGILAVKAHLLNNSVPSVVGGGTVSFVSPRSHRFIDDPERREEGGTPPIVESIRAGLVFALQQRVGTDTIERLEKDHAERALRRLAAAPGIELLGGAEPRRLPIFSLRFHHRGHELHYGFVVALLNDLFGIQARGGCSCAGPYGHALLGLGPRISDALARAVDADCGALRPGWVRLSFNYFIEDEEFEYLLRALELVAAEGWRLLPAYRLDVASGVWRHRDGTPSLPVRLDALDPLATPQPAEALPKPDYDGILREAEEILHAGSTDAQRADASLDPPLPADHEHLRWFVSAEESADFDPAPERSAAHGLAAVTPSG